MVQYISKPITHLVYKRLRIPSFISGKEQNIDKKTIASFGEEWLKFSEFNQKELDVIGDMYFDIVPKEIFNKDKTIVLDAGCGSGRWAKYISPKVKFVEAIDPSGAVISAKRLTEEEDNVRITQASINNIPFRDNSFDFIFCLGVLHHIPDTPSALQSLVRKLKPKGWLLLYLYYELDDRGWLFKFIFKVSVAFRKVISRMPSSLKKHTCDFIAVLVYLPFITLAKLLKAIFPKSNIYSKIPLSFYIEKSFYIIRNDALDRFGTPLEKRYKKEEIEKLMIAAGLVDITFSSIEPYWHVVGYKTGTF